MRAAPAGVGGSQGASKCDPFVGLSGDGNDMLEVNTAAGRLQVYEVFVFNDEGKIWRQFPGLHGYWGSG